MDEIEFGQTVAAQEEYEMTTNLYAAMAKASAQIEGAMKDKVNPAFRSKYADLSSVVDAIKPALAKHGLFFAQITHEQSGGVCVETVVCHESGESMSFGRLFVPATKQDAQGYGSALTYARRYSLMTAFGVPAEDDDGNAAAQSHKPAAQKPGINPKFLQEARSAAKNGVESYKAFWTSLSDEQRATLQPEHNALKASAMEAEKVAA